MTEHRPYVGNGPYCYANSLAMMLGERAPSPSVLEFTTCSPFGMQVIAGELAFFDPYGWDPAVAMDAALKAAGWESTLITGQDGADALAQLKEALKNGPVFVGPLEFGRLRYQSGMSQDFGSDHYVQVLEIDPVADELTLHDPHGHPFATLSVADFLEAWKCTKIAYAKPYMMRTNFRQVEKNLSEEDIIRRALPEARKWLSMQGCPADYMPPGSFGNGDAARWLADKARKGSLTQGMRGMLISFAVRTGARRLVDGATCLRRIGEDYAARIMYKQARLVGALQNAVVMKDSKKTAALLEELAPTYEELGDAMRP